ncbi:NAD(P)H-dependent oxidoreductase [Methanoregula sp.]|uniref:NAD(P)H-dependent oxidoreductase n=1 Tax=Methanoregula sp. TaxID=2052170 RepID=UPI002CB1EFBC|nr:NAD(P)H-dependent oxidoreductase [Methanoregula sp.]HVP97539.1 NAD(P)H-dependent oxidoreductase [Methanoregula sp.]
MKILVLNGSPKGEVSVTMQYVVYLKKRFPEHSFETVSVAHEIKKIERDPAQFSAILGKVRSADLVLWAFPLYYMLVCAQYKRFVELVFERDAQDAFSGKYAAALSTSIHYFDQTAHAYIRAVSEDLGMQYLGGYSAAMMDLLEETERLRFEKFTSLIFAAIKEKIPVQRVNPPLVPTDLVYAPNQEQKRTDSGTQKVVILTDDDGGSPNLTAMRERIRAAFTGPVETINLRELDIRGGCLGCCQCGYDNTCVYTDGYVDFYTKKLAPADIIVMAGSLHDRYLSSAWKQFFDRSFFKGHVPGLPGKQIGFVIAGPLAQVPHLREILSAWADSSGSQAFFVTDEVASSPELDGLLDTMATRLVQGAEAGYIPPRTFYATGGHKIFRDGICGPMKLVFQADYRYYKSHRMLDFPQADLKTRLANAILIPLTRIPGFRKKVFADMKYHMVAPFKAVLGDS